MLCCISRSVPQDPVVARPCGCLFERRLIEAYIADHGRCPNTGEVLRPEDLVALHSATPTTSGAASNGLGAASIPNLLERLHAEWDSVMLEQFSLRQQVTQMQQELAHALQQYEAACRVIASLTKERDELRRRQTSGVDNKNSGDNNNEEEKGEGKNQREGDDGTDPLPIPDPVLQAMEEQEKEQRQRRKERAKQPTAPPSKAAYKETAQFDVSAGGAMCVHVTGNRIYAAGAGGNHVVVQYDLPQRRITGSGLGHTQTIHTLTDFDNGSCVLSAADDGTARVWRRDEAQQLTCATTIRYPGGVEALGCNVAGGHYIVACSSESPSVFLTDAIRGAHVVVTELSHDDIHSKGCSIEVHPYGTLAAIATDGGELALFDLKSMEVDTVVGLPRGGVSQKSPRARSLSFHPDCFTIAAGLVDGSVLLWDLRNLDEPVTTLPAATSTSPPSVVAFDHTGALLAVGGKGVSVYRVDRLADSVDEAVFASLPAQSSFSRGLSWSDSTQGLAVALLEGKVRVYEPEAHSS